jgi:RNA polymerase sigma-70 factor (ECF subfamily)
MFDLGDRCAFALAYERHRAVALRAADAVLHDRAAAEDVVQEVFADLWARPGRFDASRGTLGAYVALRARSGAIDAHRARRARESAQARAGAAEPGPAAPESPADAALRAELRERLKRALAQLPAAQRAAVLLTSAHGFSMSELAHLTGTPLGTAKSRVRLGLARTRVLLESAA